MAQDAHQSFAADKGAGLAPFQETPLSSATTLFDYCRQAADSIPPCRFPVSQ